MNHQQCSAPEDLAISGATDGYFGNAIASDDAIYLKSYEIGELRRFAESRQQAHHIAQRIESACERLSAMRSRLDGLSTEMANIWAKAEAFKL